MALLMLRCLFYNIFDFIYIISYNYLNNFTIYHNCYYNDYYYHYYIYIVVLLLLLLLYIIIIIINVLLLDI